MTRADIPIVIERLRKCAEDHKKDFTYSGHVRISPLCIEVANFLEKEYIKDGRKKK